MWQVCVRRHISPSFRRKLSCPLSLNYRASQSRSAANNGSSSLSWSRSGITQPQPGQIRNAYTGSQSTLSRETIVPNSSAQAIPVASGLNQDLPTTPYQPPTKGILSILPPALVPYGELSRIDKPIGTYYLLLPCIWSTLLAAPLTTPNTAPTTILTTSLLFIAGASIMRGAGCTINDMWDRRLDAKVTRTRLRPLARGAVSVQSAFVWTGVQLSAGLAILLQFPTECFWYATPSLLFVALYPAMKRIIDYPQFVLGLTFSWGAIMGFPALGVDLLADSATLKAALALYGSNVAWTVLYDMIYAHQDLRDDKLAGIRSIVRAWEGHTKSILIGLAAVQTGLLAAAGAAIGVGPVYYAGVLGASVFGNGLQIWRVNLDDPADCWWWFRYGVWITGGGIGLGIFAEYLAHYMGLYDQEHGRHIEGDSA